MAKRRRLVITPEPIQRLNPNPPEAPARPAALGAPPIAAVAGETAAAAALAEVSGALSAARDEGRLVQRLPLDAVDERHLVRDRLPAEDEAFEALLASLRSRGQQTPIEAVRLDESRYGLISGWRRLVALRRLHAETGEDRFATVLALLRRPQQAAEAYVAMVEENEIRVGLSYYERARIVQRAVEQGVYDTEQQALRGMFGSVSRAKRSKIKSFVPIVSALDEALRFPTRIGERLGLRLAKALAEDPALAPALARQLCSAAPATAEAEQRFLAGALAAPARAPAADAGAARGTGIDLRFDPEARRVTLSGPGVDAALVAALKAWLADRDA